MFALILCNNRFSKTWLLKGIGTVSILYGTLNQMTDFDFFIAQEILDCNTFCEYEFARGCYLDYNTKVVDIHSQSHLKFKCE